MPHVLLFELPGGNDADIFHAALKRGDRITFLTAELSHYLAQPELAVLLAQADTVLEVMPFEYAEAERQVLACHAQHPIDAVLCLVDIRQLEAARLARSLGVRYLNPTSAELLRDKFLVRQRLAERGLDQPEFLLVRTNVELKAAVDALGLPVLIKPVDGYGSQNIIVLRHLTDLDPLLTPLEDLLPCRQNYGLGVQANERMLVERFMSGSIVGCDTLTIAGRHVLLGLHEKIFFPPPSFAIRGGCFIPNRGQFGEIEAYLHAVLDGVGYDWGAAHIELMLTGSGPRLIEINPRLVGAKIARLVNLTLCRSIHADLIALHCGEIVDDVLSHGDQIGVTRWIVAVRPGILAGVELAAGQDARIRDVELTKLPVAHVRPPLDNADRIGYVMVCANDRSEAEAVADHFVADSHCILR